MGIGPKDSSLLNKLSLPSLSSLSDDKLRSMISLDRQNRSLVRAAGRINRIAKDKKSVKAPPTLESVGLAPALIIKLRASGKSDLELITILKQKGIL